MSYCSKSTTLAWMILGVAVMSVALTDALHAQTHPIGPPTEFHPMVLRSGPRSNLAAAADQVVYANVVQFPGVAGIRLHMSELTLQGGSRIRYTSLFDGDVQEMGAIEAAEWNHTSAYFNGDAVLIELIAAPGSTNSLSLQQVEIQPLGEGMTLNSDVCGICHGSDDRVPSNEDFAGRIMSPGICSAIVVNADSCIVTAGHCISGSSQVIQFRVPQSLSNCAIQNPPAIHQYPITNVQLSSPPHNPGFDWAVATTGLSQGLTIVQRYGEYKPIASFVPSTGSVEIWGYGSSKICTQNYTQKYSIGPIVSLTSTEIRYRADITGGNSGSGIVRNGETIGVVTHCWSPCPPNYNIGTRINQSAFAAAIASLCPDPTPVNNECSGSITVTDGTTTFSNLAATTEGPNESGCSFIGDPTIHRDLWYDYTATCTGELTVSLCASTMTTKLAVYAGTTCPTSPNTADACDVTSCGSNRSIVTMNVQEGENLIIRVGGRTDAVGSGSMTITCEIPPPTCLGDLNDDGEVDGLDLLILLGSWGACPGCAADLNDDDEVDGLDLLIILGNWGSCI